MSHASRQELARDTVLVSECIDQAKANLSSEIGARQAVLEGDVHAKVAADRVLLTTVYQNLISNALKYSDERPAIRFTAGRDAEGQCVLGVSDEGMGIPEEFREKVFQPFVRLQARHDKPGSGIGLSLCAKVIERLGGRIWVESKAGRGTHVRFTLPAAGDGSHG